MGQQEVHDEQAGFSSGLNITSDPAFLRPDQARQLRNYRLADYGAALKRLGTVLTTASAITVQDTTNNASGGIYWPKQASIYLFCAATNSSTMHVYSGTYSLPSVSTWSDLGAIPQWRPVIFSDGSNEVMYVAGNNAVNVQKIATNGTTISALTAGTAQVAGLVVYNDRLWGWSGNSLYYSQLSSLAGSTGGDSLGLASAGGGQIVVNTFGNSTICCCKVVNGILEIHHQVGISTLTGWGQDDIQVTPQPLNNILGPGWTQIQAGTDVGDSVVVANELSTGDIAYFITTLGAYASTGSAIKPLSTPDKPDPLAALIQAGTISLTQISVTFNRRYNEVWFNVRGGGANVGIYAYNVILQSWSGPYSGNYVDTRAPSFFTVLDNSGQPWLWRLTTRSGAGSFAVESDSLMGSSANPVYLDSVTANGTTTGTGGAVVTGTLQLHRMFAGSRVQAKTFRWFNVLATIPSSGTPPTVACSTVVAGTSTLTFATPTGVESSYYLSPGGQGPYLDATITDLVSNGASQYALATVDGNFLGQR